MRTLDTNFDNDIYMLNSSISICTELLSVLKNCEYAAKSQLGEMLFAIDRGVPNFQTVWQSSTNVAQFEVYLRDILSSVEGVTGITSLEVQVEGNILKYTAEIQTIYGSGMLSDGI